MFNLFSAKISQIYNYKILVIRRLLDIWKRSMQVDLGRSIDNLSAMTGQDRTGVGP